MEILSDSEEELPAQSSPMVNGNVAQLVDMGFTPEQAAEVKRVQAPCVQKLNVWQSCTSWVKDTFSASELAGCIKLPVGGYMCASCSHKDTLPGIASALQADADDVIFESSNPSSLAVQMGRPG